MLSGSTRAPVAPFGVMPGGTAVEIHTLTNASGMEVCFLSLGGIITSVKVPGRDGVVADVTLGYDTLEAYVGDSQYFGALVGRYANRIAGGRFSIDGTPFVLPTNDGANTLHGGPQGFHAVVWNVEPFEAEGHTGAVLTHVSPQGTSGFPGELAIRITYTLTDDSELIFEYHAVTDAPTPVNLTQHLYLNLAGHAAGSVLGHELQIAAGRYLPVDDALIPTGEIAPVQGTSFDLRTPRLIGEAMREDTALLTSGFDHTFVLDGTAVAARLVDPASGRCVEIETTEPGIQFYAGGMIEPGTRGKDGAVYEPFTGLALETQHFPDSPNVPTFPSTILRPGVEYRSRSVYRFGLVAS